MNNKMNNKITTTLQQDWTRLHWLVTAPVVGQIQSPIVDTCPLNSPLGLAVVCIFK